MPAAHHLSQDQDSQVPNGHNLLDADIEAAAVGCGVRVDEIESVRPATLYQQDVMKTLAPNSTVSVGQLVCEIGGDVDQDRMALAWTTAMSSMPILRTRIVDLPGVGLVQVVLKKPLLPSFKHVGPLTEFAASEKQTPFGLGDNLVRVALVDEPTSRWLYLCWTFSYAVVDRACAEFVLDYVRREYFQENGPALALHGWNDPPSPYSISVDADRFWREQSAGVEAAMFPNPEAKLNTPCPSAEAKHVVPLGFARSSSGFAASTIVQAAWSILISRYTDTPDVVFGSILGEDQHMRNSTINYAAGPSTRAVFVRAKLDPMRTIDSLLTDLNDQANAMRPYEATGLLSIRNVSDEAAEACSFQNMLCVRWARPPALDQNIMLQPTRSLDPFGAYSQYGLLVDCELSSNAITIRARYDSDMMDQLQMERILRQFTHVIRQLRAEQLPKRIQDVSVTSHQDLEEIQKWNSKDLSREEACVHDLIEQQLTREPCAAAVAAWDKELTCAELSDLSSRLASHLVSLGVSTEDVVPIYCERSAWVPISLLAVLKAGSAVLLLDQSTPAARLRLVCQKVAAKVVLVPQTAEHPFEDIIPTVVRISLNILDELPRGETGCLPRVRPANLAFVVFTSGSTGEPKGVMIEHRAWAAVGLAFGTACNMDTRTRVLQFASYAFLLSLIELSITLLLGGCICIPSPDDRANNAVGYMNAAKVNWASVTPSFAGMLDPAKLPTLQTLVLVGEALTADVLAQWEEQVSLIYAYGVSELSGLCSALLRSKGLDRRNMGRGTGTRLWIADLYDPSRLAAIGCVGELVAESPGVARGYVGWEDLSKTGFADTPPWSPLAPAGKSRTTRFFRTGDLVRYASDGTVLYLGRKDAQVKLRGQRIELGEVEYQLRKSNAEFSKLAVEVISLSRGRSRAVLAAFVAKHTSRQRIESDVVNPQLPGRLQDETSEKLQQQLSSVLPAYMVPSLYFVLPSLPMTATGKVDRKRLRELGAQAVERDLDESSSASRHPKEVRTRKEVLMCQVWARMFNVDGDSLEPHTHFLHVGGDSVLAMRMVSVARELGLGISVAQIFQHPRLVDMAAQASSLNTRQGLQSIAPFSLVPDDIDAHMLVEKAATLCNCTTGEIEDMYPCTPLQEGLMVLTSSNIRDYIIRITLKLWNSIDLGKFRSAWEALVLRSPALRTRIVLLENIGFYQVVIKNLQPWETATDMKTYIEDDKRKSYGVGQPLSHQAIIQGHVGEPASTRHFVWTAHHGVVDGWSLALLARSLESVYNGFATGPQVEFNAFIKHVIETEHEGYEPFWRAQTEGYDSECFPLLPRSATEVDASGVVEYQCLLPPDSKSNVTPASLMRAAWATVVAKCLNIEEVCFGYNVTGRSALLAGIDTIIGPTVATVPIVVHVDRAEHVQTFLQRVHDQATAIMPFEQTGLQRIAKVSPYAQNACAFQTLLTFQTGNERLDRSTSLGDWQHDRAVMTINTYPLVLECWRNEEGVNVIARFDPRAIERQQLQRMLEQMGLVARQMLSAPSLATMGDIKTASDSDLAQIWEWNASVPPRVDATIHQLFSEQVRVRGDSVAIDAWDGPLTFTELDGLSTSLAQKLTKAGVCRNVVVPFCIEKSRWTAVVAFAVMKAGGASLALDMTLPEERLRRMIEQVNTVVILASAALEEEACRLTTCPIITICDNDTLITNESHSLEPVEPQDALYVIFTSGSTGVPKGIVITHANFASAHILQHHELRFDRKSRVLDFASCAFDVFWSNMLHTLLAGGCLCVPSAERQINDLIHTINELDANYVHLTPSVSRMFDWSSVRGLRTLQLGGEPLGERDFPGLPVQVEVIHSYGPAECTVTTVASRVSLLQSSFDMGKPMGCTVWVVDPANQNGLVPIGSIGELWIEGPLVGRGYLNAEESSLRFVLDEPWLREGGPGHLGRHGRLFRTGDLVRYRADGRLQFISRIDNQVKIRGQRVDLAEVEDHVQASLSLDSNAERPWVLAQVLCLENDPKPRLVVFFTTPRAKAEIDEHTSTSGIITSLYDGLKKSLPSYMVPSMLIPLKTAPLTVTGKTDHSRLRELASSISSHQKTCETAGSSQSEPSNELERAIRSIWAQVLELDETSISVKDSFLELGGDSITAMIVVSKCRSNGISLSIRDLLRFDTIERIVLYSTTNSALVGSQRTSETSRAMSGLGLASRTESVDDTAQMSISWSENDHNLIQRGFGLAKAADMRVNDVIPCTPPVEGILLSRKLGKASYMSYRIWECAMSQGAKQREVSPERLSQAWVETLARHELFSSVFLELPEAGGFVQAFLDGVNSNVHHLNADNLSAAETLQEMDPPSFMKGEPEYAVAICEAKDGTVACRMDVNHAMLDAASMTILIEEIAKSYDGVALGTAPNIKEAVKYVGRAPSPDSLIYWKDFLHGCEPCMLQIQASEGPTANHPTRCSRLDLVEIDSVSLTKFCRAQRITRSALLQAAWALVLSYYTESSNVCFGYAASGRDLPVNGIKDMVGAFTNILVGRVDVDLGVDEALSAIQHYTANHFDHQHISLSTMQQEAGLKGQQLFNTGITVRDTHIPFGIGAGLELHQVNGNDSQEFDFVLTANMDGPTLALSLLYRHDAATATAAQEIGDKFGDAVDYIINSNVS